MFKTYHFVQNAQADDLSLLVVLSKLIHFHQQSKNVWVTRSCVIAVLSRLLLVNKHFCVSVRSFSFIPAYYAAEYPNLLECQVLNMEAACSSGRSVTVYQMTCSFLQDLDFDQYCCENLTSYSVDCFLIDYKIRGWEAGCDSNVCVSYWLHEPLLTAWCHVYWTHVQLDAKKRHILGDSTYYIF